MRKLWSRIRGITPKRIWVKLKAVAVFTWENVIFIGVLFLYMLRSGLRLLFNFKLIRWLGRFLKVELWRKGISKLMAKMDYNGEDKVSRSFLIELAFRNMKSKKNRAFVTIGGVALGVGAIVFLVSVGYGLEKMVISRVTRLEELRMADITTGKTATLKMDDETLTKIKEFAGVEEVIPIISMVSKLKYNNSVLDVMALGVDERYIKAVKPKFLTGEMKDKDKEFSFTKGTGEVAGVKQEIVWVNKDEKAKSGVVAFNIIEGERTMVMEGCSNNETLLGYALRSEGGYLGEEVWGEHYYLGKIEEKVGRGLYEDGEFSKWMRAKIPLWGVNEGGVAHPILDENGRQKWVTGCMMEEGILVDEEKSSQLSAGSLEEYMRTTETDGEVLGLTSTESAVASSSASNTVVATASANLFEVTVATDSAGVEWVELKKTTEEDKNKMKEIQFVGQPVAEAFVSTGMLRLFGIPVAEAIGKKFLVSYIIPDGLIPGIKGRLQSAEVEYKVSGVVEDETSNYYYFQIADAKRLGVKSYSQVKVVAKDQELLPDIRKSIETLGFKTTSTVDTVAEIEKLFRNLRMILGFLGTIALAVASLGMFNTMTVSLLERTREVGVMKAMGMLSNEVRELFLAESMIMGVGGGMLGVLFGYLAGRLLSIFLSSVSVLKGQGLMDIAYIPWFFVVFILLISFVVGVLTGWYPSKRARSISALNALRYE